MFPQGYYVVPVIGGVAIPDLSQGLIQFVLLTGTTTIRGPINAPGQLIWTVILRQDSVGGHLAIFGNEDGYFGSILGGLIPAANSQSMINWTIDYNGNNTLNGIITGEPHP